LSTTHTQRPRVLGQGPTLRSKLKPFHKPVTMYARTVPGSRLGPGLTRLGVLNTGFALRKVGPGPGIWDGTHLRHGLEKLGVDALGVVTISRGCFERCYSNKKTPPHHSNVSFVTLRNRRPTLLRAPAYRTRVTGLTRGYTPNDKLAGPSGFAPGWLARSWCCSQHGSGSA